ncbi:MULTISPECIES: CaiB/BaiF CoA transferase family protein [Chelativorans]|uniref:L-carnitine dehydratase/bile acid-inducible protein F n=1 Tax=Chelativorans sp. (strain BNC1) TaxID=266779 RepID=Q11E49_CHESB|nr:MULTISPECIES: CoA transferase [Chelativorans]
MEATVAGASRDGVEAPWSRLPVVRPGEGFKMLNGIRVLDLTTSVAGPYATMLLSDFGAEIIKIERPAGDDARHWGPPFLDEEALWFTSVNRNKKSVVLDMNEPEGRRCFEALAATADVVVSNQPPNVQRKLRLDYDTLRSINDSVVFVSITGFGVDGERSDLTCYDLIAEGYSGIMDITGAADGPPQKIGAPAADMLAGQDAAMAVMAALFARQTSKRGAKIDISLVESMTRFLTCRISSYLGSGEVPVRSGGTDSVIAVYQCFETADRPITIGIGSDAIWTRFWAGLGDPEYGARPEFASNTRRRERRDEIVSHIQSILRCRTSREWLDIFARARVPAGPINTVSDVAHDRALQERGMFYTLEDGDRKVPQIGLGIRIDGASAIPRSGPPLLGQHTEEVLTRFRGAC